MQKEAAADQSYRNEPFVGTSGGGAKQESRHFHLFAQENKHQSIHIAVGFSNH